MNLIAHSIANRLSLRPPQRESLAILENLCNILPLEKNTNVSIALQEIRAQFPSVTDFERDFPSLCFALATGVGKTRLMGAFIAYLHKAEGIRHFFVLAPNLTIYDKLIADFTPNTPKYVFQGISEFVVNPPEIITGDNYETGRGIRNEQAAQKRLGFAVTDTVHINIFNIAKITSTETPKGAKKTNVPRFRRLQEYIGQSYFEYLSGLDDLVLLMDESHRYRASAGMRAISELKPILGLELTATPQIEKNGGVQSFKNIIYNYPLSTAMIDGFVKEPAVATRENFDAKNYDEARLEKLKLEDGIRLHENTKVELEIYAREHNKPIVKPFMLVVAKDTGHADTLMKMIGDPSFFEGHYRGKIIQVHSKQTGEERDETVAQLISVEQPNNPTEIVIHVNMLKEGWDVTNLYTIVPLRAANSKTLVEQSIGRGLRLPYGKRTGVGVVDRLTIISHDKFQEIVDYANSPESIIRGGIRVIHITDERSRPIEAEPEIRNAVQGTLFETSKEREVAVATLEVIREFEHLPRSADLAGPEVLSLVIEKVKQRFIPIQGAIEGIIEGIDVSKIVSKTIQIHNDLSIDIPRITIYPVGEAIRSYRSFKLDLASFRQPPVEEKILIQELHSREQHRLIGGNGMMPEERPENYLVRGLMDFDDIPYDDNAELLFALAAQVVEHLRSYLKEEDQVLNVLQRHHPSLVKLIHAQMESHFVDQTVTYKGHVSKGFTTLRSNNFSVPIDENERDFRAPISHKLDIRKMLFSGFKRCLYRIQKFDSDSERRFAVILETDEDVLKWFKPSKGTFQIHYHGNESYEPDFVVETKSAKFICEPKRSDELLDAEVVDKAKAAVEWCKYATEHQKEYGGKPWLYVLIPHDVVLENKTLTGLVADYCLK